MTDHCYTPLSLLEMLVSSDTLDTVCVAALKGAHVATTVTWSFYLFVFVTTCLLEALVYFPAGLRKNISSKKIIFQILLLNLATHPFIFLVVPLFSEKWHISTLQTFLFSETFAPVVEMFLLFFLYKYGRLYAFITAICANLLSWWLGIKLFSFFLG